MFERLDRTCMRGQVENVCKTKQKIYERLDRKCMKEYRVGRKCMKDYERLDRKCMKDQIENV